MSSRRNGRKDAPSSAAAGGKKAKTDATSASSIAPPVNAIKKGTDSEGKEYADLNDLWKAEFEDPDATPDAAAADAAASSAAGAPVKKSLAWYQKGAGYWASQAASVDGVLGGFGHVSPVDIAGSKAFLASIPGGVKYGSAIDCGAGIGRISKGLLAPLFKFVDLVEQDPKYVAKAREYCAGLASMRDFVVEGLQSFGFPRGSYDVIWIQWVIGHLPDRDFVPFMERASAALAPGGVICLKENIAKKGFVMDLDDQSVTRTDAQYRELFEKSNLELVATELQKNFPSVLFPVRMYALRPKASAADAAQAAPAAAAGAASTPATMEA